MSEGVDGFGAVATAGLIARELERGCGGADQGGGHGEACANCGTVRLGSYCHSCGQMGHVHRNLHALVHDIAHGVFHFEGKIWNTLPMLALKPGELTRRYVHGERAKFVSPMALFLFSVFLMFAVMSGLGEHQGRKAATHAKKATSASERLDDARTEVATLKTVRGTLPAVAQPDMDKEIAAAEAKVTVLTAAAARDAKTPGKQGEQARAQIVQENFDSGIPFINETVRHIAANPELAAYKVKTYAYKYSWALIPISVPFIWLLFAFRRDVGPYDHAIFAIYSISFMSLGVVTLSVLGWIGLPTAVIALAAMIIPPIHMYNQLRGAYLLGRVGAGWRTFAMLIISAITLSLFLSFLIWMGSD